MGAEAVRLVLMPPPPSLFAFSAAACPTAKSADRPPWESSCRNYTVSYIGHECQYVYNLETYIAGTFC